MIPALHETGDLAPHNYRPVTYKRNENINNGQGLIIHCPNLYSTPPPTFGSQEKGPPPSLIAPDAAGFHKTPEVKDKLRENNIIPSFIPPGCSGLAQVLDVAVNKPLKGILREVLDEIMENMGKAALEALDDATDSAKGRRRIIMTFTIGEA